MYIFGLIQHSEAEATITRQFGRFFNATTITKGASAAVSNSSLMKVQAVASLLSQQCNHHQLQEL